MFNTSPCPTIGLAAPSYTTPDDELRNSLNVLSSAGFNVCTAPNVSHVYGHFAGDETARAEGLMQLCQMPEVDFILMTRGGNGALRMLPYLDWTKVNPNQPWIGFSDSTALLNARVLKTGTFSWHAPMLRQLTKGFAQNDNALVERILNGQPPRGYGSVELSNTTILKNGQTTGTLWGGNLAILRSLCGTPWMPQPKPGDILFFEELFTNDWHADRDLEQLVQAGFFDNAGGIIFGSFSEIVERRVFPFGFTMREVFERHSARINGPVIMDFPAGHEGLNLPLPIGAKATLTAAQGSGVTLTWEI